MLNLREVWNARFQEVKKPRVSASVFLAFDASIDYAAKLDEALAQKTINSSNKQEIEKRLNVDAKTVKTREEALGLLLSGMKEGLLRQVFSEKQAVDWVSESATKTREVIGGNTGVAGNQLACIGAKVIAFTPWLSKKQAKHFDKKISFPTLTKGKAGLASAEKAVNSTETSEDWILEYSMGQKLSVGDKTIQAPRSNRVTFHYKRKLELMPEELLKKAKAKISTKIQIFSGFHHGCDKKALEKQFLLLPKAYRHWEYSDMHDHPELIPIIAKNIDSIGLNERELASLLDELGLKSYAKSLEAKENAYTIYEGCLKVLEKLKLKRVHCHNLGYHVCVTDKKHNPDKIRDAISAAAILTSIRAEKNADASLAELKEANYSVSETGLNQVWIFESGIDPFLEKKHSSKERKAFLARGWVEMKNHYAIVVPTPIVQTKALAGLGDSASACALVFEKS